MREEVKINFLNLLDKDTFLHLRIPFSFYLLPVFCFALSQAPQLNWWNTAVLFIALHFFIYPGSNIYNSYMDKDEGSIGGLENPPPVTKKLYYASILFDSIGIALSLLIDWRFMVISLLYIGVSKAYSWDKIRLKKYAVGSWLVVLFFQGGYTFMLVHMCITNNFTREWFTTEHLMAATNASLLIGGFYPLTQIYQHGEDTRRGDHTISSRLGYRGTFIFSALFFISAGFVFYNYFQTFYSISHFLIFIACLLPVIAFFLYWFYKVYRNINEANYTNAMRINLISACCMILCFGVLFYLNH